MIRQATPAENITRHEVEIPEQSMHSSGQSNEPGDCVIDVPDGMSEEEGNGKELLITFQHLDQVLLHTLPAPNSTLTIFL